MKRHSLGRRPRSDSRNRFGRAVWAVFLVVLASLPATQSCSAASIDSDGRPRVGIASWYGRHHVGRQTASGEIHSGFLRTAAHRSLPFGTLLKVTNLRNGRTSVVRINDRGPFVTGRTIDLSEQAARDLAMLDQGLARVRLEILHDGAY